MVVNLPKDKISSFEEIRALIDELPGPDHKALDSVIRREGQLTKPSGALGRLEELTRWLASWQGKQSLRLVHPRAAVFAGNHGVALRGVSAFPPEVTQQMVQNFIEGGAAINQLCKLFDADLRVYELALDQPTADFTKSVAMSDEECLRAMAYGMTAIESGLDIICLGEMGIGNTTSAAAICLALYGGTAGQWIGCGSGIDDIKKANKTNIVSDGVEFHRNLLDDPLKVLAALGGFELAAIAGAILAARLAKVPVVLDGFACTAASAILHSLRPGTLDHCLVSHLSVEPGHGLLLEKIGKIPLMDLGMRLGEASGATLALGLLKAAVECHNGMATFEDANVSRV